MALLEQYIPDILKVLLGSVLAVGAYLIKRKLERRRTTEALDRKWKVLQIEKQRRELQLRPEDLHRLEHQFVELNSSVPQRPLDSAASNRLFGTHVKLLEILAIHAGNEAQDAAILAELVPGVVSQSRLNLARATFHAVFRMLKGLGVDSENSRWLRDYEERIPVPEKYAKELERFR